MSAGLPWFRLYAEAIDDEKIRLLAFEDRWHYTALLCCKCAGLLDAGDSIELLHRKLAVKLGLALRELEAMALRLSEVGLIDAVTFQPLGWDVRQMRSDTSKERVRAHRERKKQGCNVTETAASVSVTASAGDVALALEAIAAKSSFADWWAVYPHKTGRKPCEAKWKSAGLDAIADKLIADTINRAANDAGWVGGYYPNPLTYLNQERWNDDLRTAPVARSVAPAEPSKTLGAMLKIRGMTNGMAGNRTAARPNEVALLGSGSDPGE